MTNLHETTISPPYTNRWGTKPGPTYRRCQATTKKGDQCRACASEGKDVCWQHDPEKVDFQDYVKHGAPF